VSPGSADDETVKMNPSSFRSGSSSAGPGPSSPAKSSGVPIAAGLGALAIAAVAGWLIFAPGKPPPPVSAPVATAVPAPTAALPAAPRFAIRTASEADILAHQATSLTIFRFAANPKILVLDFPDLRQQGLMLNRAAALVEKKGLPREKLLTDTELDDAIAAHGDTMESYYYGHDYAAADLARFFRLADSQGLKLRPEEEMLRALLKQEGALEPGAGMALISVPRAGSAEGVDLGLRTGILRHELSHGEFFTTPAYVAYTRRFWAEGLDEPFRDAFRRYLAAQDYDISLDDLVVNEMQAYLMHTTDPRLFSAQALGVNPERFAQMQASFLLNMPPGWLRDCTPGPATTVTGSAKP
jgi:hypothetical protein